MEATANSAVSRLVPRLMKRSDQLAAFGINADHRQVMGGVVLNLGTDVAKLLIALMGQRRASQAGFKAFQVLSQAIIHFLKQPAHRVGRNNNTHAVELSGNLAGGFARPLTPADRIPGGLSRIS